MRSARCKNWNATKVTFYNWYDTQSLKPLPPAYISTVDSGNLAGHLLTLRPGLLALPERRILTARWLDGLGDTLRILVDAAGEAAPVQLDQLQKELASASVSRPITLAAARLYPWPAGDICSRGGGQF
jgi:cyclic beta-1,2-glucan synthetase